MVACLKEQYNVKSVKRLEGLIDVKIMDGSYLANSEAPYKNCKVKCFTNYMELTIVPRILREFINVRELILIFDR